MLPVEPSVPFRETEWLKFQIFGSHWLQVTLRLDGIPVFTVHDQTLGRKTFHIYRWLFFQLAFTFLLDSIHREAERRERNFYFVPTGLGKCECKHQEWGGGAEQGPQ